MLFRVEQRWTITLATSEARRYFQEWWDLMIEPTNGRMGYANEYQRQISCVLEHLKTMDVDCESRYKQMLAEGVENFRCYIQRIDLSQNTATLLVFGYVGHTKLGRLGASWRD